MGLSRTYRLVEGGLVALFFIQAARVVFASLLAMTRAALNTGQVDLLFVNGHLFLVVALVMPWFAPRLRTVLPATLSMSAIVVAFCRVAIAIQIPAVQLYAGLAVLGAGGVYFASLLRANWRSWIAVWIAGLTVDQLFRARDTFDLSLRAWVELPVRGVNFAVPWIVFQLVLSLALVVASRLARRSARTEPYEPAFLSMWGGLAFGGFLAVELIALAMPNVVARWASVPYAGLVPWLAAVTALPLLPSVRRLMGETLGLFADRLRGWVWLALLLMLIVVGNRLTGLGAAGAVTVAQLMAVLLLWWIPGPADPQEIEQVGPSFSVGLFAMVGLVYAYSLAFEYASVLPWLRDQGLVVVLLAAGLLGLPRLLWRESDPWLARSAMPRGVAVTFVAPVFVAGLLLGGLNGDHVSRPLGNTLRVATYNLNSGYDADGQFQLELAARTIEASLADVVLLQEVDTGRPLSYGADQVQFLARRLGMTSAFVPTVEQVHGLAILSRWPLDVSSLALSGSGEQLAALGGRLVDPATGRAVLFVCTRLAPAEEEERLQQLALLVGFVGDASPVVLAGDLGAPPDDQVYRQLVFSGFADPDTVLGIERGYTYPAHNPTVRHDYVLFRDLVPLDSRQVDSLASDHRLVVVEVGWPQP